MQHYDQLAQDLARHLLDGPYDPRGVTDEKFQIDHLVEITEDWAIGDMSLEALVASYRGTGYDILLWINDMIEQGVYDEDAIPS